MLDFLSFYYLWLKSIHIISVVCWMAGLFYLPRLFVYHTKTKAQSEASLMFQTMERKLARIIMLPSLVMTWGTGVALLCVPGMWVSPMGWIHLKFFLVILLSGFHGFLIRCLKDFARDQNRHSEGFFRIINEAPIFFLILIVFLVVLKPF